MGSEIPVVVKRYVEQVRDGYEYKGTITISDVEFHYRLRFAVHINELDSQRIESQEDARRVFQFQLFKDGQEVTLTDVEFSLFAQFLFEFVVGFFHNGQTRDSQVGGVGHILNGGGSDLGITASIGMTSEGTYDLPEEVCRIFSQDKFGCQLSG